MDRPETLLKNSQMFLIAYWYGEYGDFEESVLGVTDNYDKGVAYAEKLAKMINNQESRSFYTDAIVIKKFELNKCLIDDKLVSNCKWGSPQTIPFLQKYLWKISPDNSKLVNVENKNDWEKWG